MVRQVEISVVVPVFNEEKSLPILHEELDRALRSMGDPPAEIVYVDDCSTDASLHAMLELRRRDPRVKVVKFRRNFGQTAALAAGFDVSRGRIVITIDGDLQNDPADIPRLVEEIENGYDIVAGWRRKRHDALILRRLPSLVANRLIAFVTGVPIHDTGCTLKAFRRELVKSMAIYAEQHRFLPVLSAGSGARVTEVVVNHRPRRFGESKYGIGRATRVLLDLLSVKMISQFSQRPLHYFGLLSLGALSVATVFAVVSLFSFGRASSDGTSGLSFLYVGDWEMMILTVVMIVLMMFVYFVLLGLLGELVIKASGMHRRSTLDRIMSELH
ncbi:MAG: glycosyltransferase family 2 protein [Planctomycetota bacterium]|nr:glycosyltransferase family 2 protein [Planctomycetota bacterium]